MTNSPRRVCVGGLLSTDMHLQLTDLCPIPNTFRTPQNYPQRDRDTGFGPGRRFRYIPRWFRLPLVRDRAGGEALLLVRLVVRSDISFTLHAIMHENYYCHLFTV